MNLPTKPVLIGAGALALAAGSGFLASQAIGGATQTPTRTVTLNLTNGPQGPPGPPGPPGASITIKGSVSTPGDLPAAGNKPGDTYLVQSDGSIQTWDGTKWVSSGPIPSREASCPAGYTFGALVLNAPQGHVQIATCIQD